MFVFFLLMLPTLSSAQVILDASRIPEPWIEITADITGNGLPDILRSTPFDEDHDIISIKLSDYSLFIRPQVFALGANRTGEPAIEITSETSFLVRTGCFACGRTHAERLHKFAFRKGQLVVAGHTETHVDRLYAIAVTCDVNHLLGRAEIRVDGKLVDTPQAQRAYPIAEWEGESANACAGMSSYTSDAFFEEWVTR